MARNRTIDIPVNLYNYGGGTLTGLTFETTAGTGITANVINGGDNLLTAGERQNITLRITSFHDCSDTSWATMKARVNEELSKTLNVNITMVQLIPVITTSPSYIDTGMVRGDSKNNLLYHNEHRRRYTAERELLRHPRRGWFLQRALLGDIAPGASKTVGIMFKPDSSIGQGVYDDSVVINADNHIPYTHHIQVTITSNAVGNVMFDVLERVNGSCSKCDNHIPASKPA